MEPPNITPMQNYMVKMMLLEAIRCYNNQDFFGFKWVEKQMFKYHTRIKELERRD